MNHLRKQWRTAAMGPPAPKWKVNGKPFFDGVWVEVEDGVWYRNRDPAKYEIVCEMIVRREGDKWAWTARALTFIGAPHEDHVSAKPGPRKGTAKTLDEAKARAEAALVKDHEFLRKYDERMRAKGIDW